MIGAYQKERELAVAMIMCALGVFGYWCVRTDAPHIRIVEIE